VGDANLRTARSVHDRRGPDGTVRRGRQGRRGDGIARTGVFFFRSAFRDAGAARERSGRRQQSGSDGDHLAAGAVVDVLLPDDHGRRNMKIKVSA